MQEIKNAVGKIPGGVKTKAAVIAGVLALAYQFLMAYHPLFGFELTWTMIFTAAAIGLAAYIATAVAIKIIESFNDIKTSVLSKENKIEKKIEKEHKKEVDLTQTQIQNLETIPKNKEKTNKKPPNLVINQEMLKSKRIENF